MRPANLDLDVVKQAQRLEEQSSVGARSADVASIDAIVNALYQSLSFADGQAPDWARFEALFADQAQIIPVPGAAGPEAPASGTYDLKSYRARVEARRADGLRAMVEEELARRTDVFGPLAQVFSTFARTIDGETIRGINCIQLRKSGAHEAGRWRVVSVAWTDEQAELPLPSRYLPRD